jgi:catechol 2,3-dioxygenase
MVTERLGLNELLATATVEDESSHEYRPTGVVLGHIHLQVGDLEAAKRFYGDFLGLAVTNSSLQGALFFAAGGYHHHIAVNTWSGQPASSEGNAGLVSYRLEVPLAELVYCLRHRAPLFGYETRSADTSVLQIRDPNGNWLEIVDSSNAAPCPIS